jgi:hypothetical protein
LSVGIEERQAVAHQPFCSIAFFFVFRSALPLEYRMSHYQSRLPGPIEQRRRKGSGWPAICGAVALIALGQPMSPAAAQVVCTTTGNDKTCTNSGTNAGGINAAAINGNATADNSGTNSGGMLAQANNGNATATNSGTNSSGMFAQAFNGNATATNSGTNSGGMAAQAFNGNATATNSGSNTGAIDAEATGGGNATATNSGTNSGGGLASIVAHATGGGNATATNSGTNSGSPILAGADSGGSATATNSGTNSSGVITQVTGGGNATTTNSGTNAGGGLIAFLNGSGNATVTNSGTNAGDIITLSANGNAATINSGTTTGNVTTASTAAGNATTINSGTINGAVTTGGGGKAVMLNSGTINGQVIVVGTGTGTGSLTNSGRISNFGGTAIQFFGGPDTLTLLPGSFIIGGIQLVGASDTVNVRVGNQNLTFNTLAGAIVTGTVPFVVSGNRMASVEPTPFGLADKNLMDFTREVSSILGSLDDTTRLTSGPAATAFAPEAGSNRIGDAFASISGLAYAADRTMAFKNPTMVYSDGRSVWARGFAGERFQHTDDANLSAKNLFEGGAIGADLLARPDLRIGIFAGGGHSELSLDLNSGNTRTDTVFGGIYGRYAFSSFGAASFLNFALHGGGSSNSSTRNINNNLLANGLEIATASYNSSYVSPELTYGVKLPLWTDYTLTPSVRLRYVAGIFGGYTETGSTANLTVASRTIQDFEQRGELKLTRTTAFTPRDALLTSVHVGVLGIERLGDNTINTVLLGQNLPFVTPGKNTVAGVFGGLGMEWRTRSGVSFFGAAEYTAMSDQSNLIVGRGGVKVTF